MATKEDMPIVKALKHTKVYLAELKRIEFFKNNDSRISTELRTEKTENTVNGLKNLIANNVSVRITKNQK